MPKISSLFFTAYFLLFFGPNAADLLDDSSHFEGWVWRSSLNFDYKGLSLNFHDIHSKMKQKTKDIGISKLGIKPESNVAFLNISLIYKNDKSYDIVHPALLDFSKYLFVSGISLQKNNEGIFYHDKIKAPDIFLYTPINYPQSIQEIQERIEQRFNLFSGKSIIGEKVYDKLNLFNQINNINVHDTITGAIAQVFKRKSHYERTNSDSEQKIIFYFDKLVEEFPFYMNLKILKRLDTLTKLIREWIIFELKMDPNKRQNFDLTVKTQFYRLLHSSLSDFNENFIGIEDFFDLIKETSNINPSLSNQKENPRLKILNLSKQVIENLKIIEQLYHDNPLGVHVDIKSKQFMAKILNNIKLVDALFQGNNNVDIARLYMVYEELVTCKISNIEPWFEQLYKSIKNLSMEGVILNLHSKYDICGRCAPSLTRELERKDGFIGKLRSIILASSKNSNPQLFFNLITSCSIGRKDIKDTSGQSRLNKFKDEHSDDPEYVNDLMDPNYAFVQTLLSDSKGLSKESSSEDESSSADMGFDFFS